MTILMGLYSHPSSSVTWATWATMAKPENEITNWWDEGYEGPISGV